MVNDRELLQAILHNTPSVISLKDGDGRYTVANPNLEAVVGIPCERIIGRTDFDLFPPETARVLRENDLRAFSLGSRITVEETLRIKGRDRIFLSHKFPVSDDSDRPLVCCISREITERKKSERDLFLFKYLIERSSEPFHVISPAAAFRFVYVNDAACRHFGMKREELLALRVPDYDPLFDEEKCQAVAEELRHTKSLHFESRHRRADGSEIPVELWVNAVEYQGQELLAGWFHDISERKKAEEALRQSQERYTLVSRATNDVIRDWNLITGRVEWNDAVEETFGWKKEELGNTIAAWCDRIHPDDRERVRHGLKEALAHTFDTWTDEYKFRCRDGSWGAFIDRGFIVRDSQGKAWRMISSMLDLTERQMMDEALRQSEMQFRQLAEALPQLVWIARPDGYVEYFNSRWYEFTGCTAEDSRGDLWSRSVHPDDYQRTLDRWDYSVRTGESYEVECRIRRGADGSYRWFLGRGVPVRDRKGEIVRWIGTCTDIDPQKQTEEDLRNTLEELIRSNRELEQFAYVASHDLQEPLRMVASFVQILGRKYRGRLDEKADTYIRYASEGATRMQQLIDDLLSFSRIGRSTLYEPVDMNSVFATVVGQLEEQVEETKTEVTSDILPVVSGDRAQLELLLLHLIGNGMKYRKEGIPPRIHVSATITDGEWRFSVRDNGIGIEPQYFGKIFLIFQRLHTREEYPGTGIGLAACRKIVERHRGRIWVDSEPGEGSTFYFTIPIEQKAQEPLRQPREEEFTSPPPEVGGEPGSGEGERQRSKEP